MQPTNPSPGPTSSVSLQDGTQLDPGVVKVMRAIRQVESSGNYNAVGDHGSSMGAYQWNNDNTPVQQGQLPSHWKNAAQQYLGNANAQMTPENQNKVAYNQIAAYKAKGLQPEEIAALWNGAHKDPTTGMYTYNDPSYGQQFRAALQNPGVKTSPPSAPAQNQNTYGAIAPASPNDTPVIAGIKAAVNVPSSALNFAQSIGSAVMHPVQTVTGIGNAALGGVEEGIGALTGKPVTDTRTQTFDALKSAIGQRYGSLENAQATATNDPFGVGTDVLTTLYGGAGLLGKASDIVGITGASLRAADLSKALTTTGRHLTSAGQVLDAAPGTNITDLLAQTKANMVQGLAGEGQNAASKLVSSIKTDGMTSVDELTQAVKDSLQKGATSGVGLATNLINKGVSTTAGLATAPLRMAGNLVTDLGGKVLGTGGGVLNEAIGSAVKGGDAYASYLKGLSGNVSQDALVNQTRNALQEVMNQRSAGYKQMIVKNLGADKTTYDISSIYKATDKQLENFGITKDPRGDLNFSRSKFALDTTAQKDIQNLYNYVRSYGSKAGDRTALGVDNLKQILGGYWSPNSDYRALVQGIKDSARNVLSKAPGYDKAMAAYSEMSDDIADIQKGLSLGDNAAVETSFKKITNAFKQNNEFRQQLIQSLDTATGGKLSPLIAGQQLSSYTPRGLVGTLQTPMTVLAGTALGGGAILPVLGMLIGTSPKLVGTLIRTLHLPAQGYNLVMNLLNKAAVPATVVGAGTVNRVTNSKQ